MTPQPPNRRLPARCIGPFAPAAGPRRAPGFTLIELMVSMVVTIIVMSMVAVALQQARQISSETSARAETAQIARNLFDQIERDLSGLTRNSFLLIRKEGGMRQDAGTPSTSMADYSNCTIDFTGLQFWLQDDGTWGPTSYTNNLGQNVNLDPDNGLLPPLFRIVKETGEEVRVTIGRTDWLAMITTGSFIAQSDAVTPAGVPYAGLPANTARVIYAHSNRVLANLNVDRKDLPDHWSSNWTLLRQQTLLYPLLSYHPDFTGAGDGSGGPGLNPNPTRADIADLSFNELIGTIRWASMDRTFNGRTRGNPGSDAQQASRTNGFGVTDVDWSDFKPETAILRYKRDDLNADQILNGNIATANKFSRSPDRVPAGYGNVLGIDYGYWLAGFHPENTYGFSEGYQRPRVLPNTPGEDGNINTLDDNGSTMYGRIAVMRCPHFRVDYTCGTVNERGELVWEGSIYTRPDSLMGYMAPSRTERTLQISWPNDYGLERPQTNAFAFCSPKTPRESALMRVPTIRNPVGNTNFNPQVPFSPESADHQRWPVAIRVQVVIYDPRGREPVGYLYSRVMPIPRI